MSEITTNGTGRPQDRSTPRTSTLSGYRRTQEHDSNPRERAARGQRHGSQDARDGSRGGLAEQVSRDRVEERIADAAGEEAVRNRQGAARDGRADRGRQGGRDSRRGPFRLAHADAAPRGFSEAA